MWINSLDSIRNPYLSQRSISEMNDFPISRHIVLDYLWLFAISMFQCDGREHSQCPEEVARLAHSPTAVFLPPRPPDSSILRIRHRSFTSLDTPNNCKADQGANSVHDLLMHNG